MVARKKASRAESVSGEADAEQRRQWIETAAYFRAEARGFEPGGEVDDWVEAEREIEARQSPD